MSILSISTLTPLPGKLPAVIQNSITAVRIVRKHAPNTTLWWTTHGAASSSDVHMIASFETITSSLAGFEKVVVDPEMQSMLAASYADGPSLAGPMRRSISTGLPGFERPLLADATSPRAAFVYVTAVHPDMFEVQAAVRTLSEKRGFIHSAAIRGVAGMSPDSLMVLHLAPSMEALGDGMDSIGQDPEYLALMAKYGSGKLGSAILQEIIVA